MKKYTFKDFLDGKVDVRCENDEQKKAFLKVCAKHGLLWHHGDKADAFVPKFSIISTKGFNDGRLGHTWRPIADACVGFDEIDISTAPRYKIVIESDGETTTAKMLVNGKEVKQATAKRNPADKANWRTGAQVAFDRLWQKQPKPEKPAEKDGFKVGDRVVCTTPYLVCNGKHGRIAVMEGTCECNIGVEFDEDFPGNHNCSGYVKSGRGYWLFPDFLSHEQPTMPHVREVKRQAKAGEYIKLTKKMYSFDKVGLILRADKADACTLVLHKNHPACPYDKDPDFEWAYKESGYVVLEGYQPGRDA